MWGYFFFTSEFRYRKWKPAKKVWGVGYFRHLDNSPSFQLLPFFLSVSSLVNFNLFFIFSFSLPPNYPLYLPSLPIPLHASTLPVFLLDILSNFPFSCLQPIPSPSSLIMIREKSRPIGFNNRPRQLKPKNSGLRNDNSQLLGWEF